MQVIKSETHEESSRWVANQIIEELIKKPNLLICLASGHSPMLAVKILVEDIKSKNIDYSKLFFIGLDEWVGIPPFDTGSCAYFFQEYLIKPLALPHDQFHLFDGMSSNLEIECKKMDAIINLHGSIDIMVVGIGMNGHIGFNEPGTPFNSTSHVANLEDITKNIGQKYFEDTKVLSQGITTGLGQLSKSNKVILIANGEKKAEVINKAVRGSIDPAFPASIMQLHANGYVVVDTEASNLL